MAIKRAVAPKKPGRLKIPKPLLDKFKGEVVFILPHESAGIWPLNPMLLRDRTFINKLLADRNFKSNYELAVIAKG